MEQNVNKRIISSPTNCAVVATTTKSDLTNVASSSTTQNVTLSANFNEQRDALTKQNDYRSSDDDDDNDVENNESKEVNVDTNLQQVSKRKRKRSLNCSNKETEEDKVRGEHVKVSLANYNTKNENFQHENDDANDKCLTRQTNDSDFGSKLSALGLERDSSLRDNDELLTNNNGKQQQRTQSSVIVGSLKVRDEFIESKSQSFMKNMHSDAGDNLQQHHIHHTIKAEVKTENEEEREEAEEGNNTVGKIKYSKRSQSRCSSPSLSNSSIKLPAIHSNHSLVHYVGGSSGCISKDKTTFQTHNEKHPNMEIKNKGKFFNDF